MMAKSARFFLKTLIVLIYLFTQASNFLQATRVYSTPTPFTGTQAASRTLQVQQHKCVVVVDIRN